ASLGRGSGLTNVYSGSPFLLSRAFASVTTISTTENVADTALAVSNQLFFGFNMQIKENYKVSLKNLNSKIRISAAGAKVWYLKYSLDGINFYKADQPVTLNRATDGEGEFLPQTDLST